MVEATNERPAAEAKRIWKPWTVTVGLFAAPVVLTLGLLALLAAHLLEVVNVPAPQADVRANAPLEELWTQAERERLGDAPVFQTGLMADDLTPWRYTPPSGVGSVRASSRNTYQQAITALGDALAPGGDRSGAALDGVRRLLDTAAGSGANRERVPILYHEALAAYLAGDLGLARALLEGTPGQSNNRGALALIAAARNDGLSEAMRLRLDGEEIAVRRLLGHIQMRQRRYDEAATQFRTSITVAERAGQTAAYRRTYALVFNLRPESHLIGLSTGALWNDLLAARMARGNLEPCGEDPGEAYCRLYQQPRQVVTYPPLAVTLALLAARDGRRGRVQSLTLDPLPPEGTLRDNYVLARRAVGLASEGAAINPTRQAEVAAWDRLACLRQQRAPWLGAGGAVSGLACPRIDLGAFETAWSRQFNARYAQALQSLPSGLEAVASDPRFSLSDRWNATQRLRGGHPWLSAVIVYGWALACLLATAAAFFVSWRYDQVFRPLHLDDRAGETVTGGLRRIVGGLAGRPAPDGE